VFFTSERNFPFPDQERFAHTPEHELRFDFSVQKSETLKNLKKSSISEKKEEQIS